MLRDLTFVSDRPWADQCRFCVWCVRIVTFLFASLISDPATCLKMLEYGKFSLFLENVAVCFCVFLPLDSGSSTQPGSVGLYLRAHHIICFGYFVDRNSVVLPEEVE